jgi:hypothetical protein
MPIRAMRRTPTMIDKNDVVMQTWPTTYPVDFYDRELQLDAAVGIIRLELLLGSHAAFADYLNGKMAAND